MDNNSTTSERFTVVNRGDYIHLETHGPLDVDNLDAPANAALAMAQESGISKLLDDIRNIDTTNVSMAIQTKAMGILWHLRQFKKVAIVYETQEIGRLFFASLEAAHLDSKFKGFDNVPDAITWLQESKD